MNLSRCGPQRPLAGRVGIVTGASRGIGAQVARSLVEAGANLALAARTERALSDLASELSETHGGQVVAIPTDVTDSEAVRLMVEETLRRLGKLDLAVNNAGGGFTSKAPVGQTDPDEFASMLRLNLLSVQASLRYEVPAMLASGGGTIVNMSSGSGQRASAGMGAYVAAKHGMEGLTKVAALDHARDNVRINAVAPGPVRAGALLGMDKRFQDLAAASSPMGRIAEPAEVGDAVVWLCSDQSSNVTGAIIPIDGGQSAGRHGGEM